jgi:flagellar brake protein
MNNVPTWPSPVPPPTEAPLEPTDYQQFMLHGRSEVLYLLRSLYDSGDRLALHFNEGRDALPTQVLAIEEDAMILDLTGDLATNQRALAADRLFAVTRHDRVRVQFVVGPLAATEYAGAPAFRCPLPEAVLRLQRREFYRLALPADESLKCRIPVNGGEEILTANIIDISGGGLAVIVPPDGLHLEPGQEFPHCRIELPEVGIVSARLHVCTLFDLTLPSGTQVHRAGCRFVDLPGTMLTLVQRYVIKAERERKARMTGLA